MTYSHNGFCSPSKIPRSASKKVHNHNPNLSLDGRLRPTPKLYEHAKNIRPKEYSVSKILGRKIANQFRIIGNKSAYRCSP